MMATETFEDWAAMRLDDVAPDPTHVNATDLEALWNELFPESDNATRVGWRAFERTFAGAVSEESGDDTLYLRPGGWTVDASGTAVKASLATALLTGVLLASGLTGLTPLVAPAVLPLLFDIRRVRLTRSQDAVLAELRMSEQARHGGLTEEQLYSQLPTRIRDQLSWLDFVDFLDQVRRAGLSDTGPDGRVVLRSPGRARFRLTIT
jgi:hypothetical protein